jgi:FKBP-type peptidyl-prolyl cis-trans isomerase FklB
MRPIWIAVLILGILSVRASAETTTTTPPAETKPVAEKTLTLTTQLDKVSYAIGVQIAKSMVQDGIDLNVDILAKAMKDAFAGAKLLMTQDEMQKTMIQLTNDVRQKQTQLQAAAAEKNKKDGEAFLAENKKKPDVITLPSGLQYKIIKAGTGKKPVRTDTVECNYRGTLLDGTEFDSSDRHPPGPSSFQVGRVIPAWTEALLLMPVGSKWQLFIPSAIGYGEAGNGPDIGPNATLLFDIELLTIK